MPVEKQSTTICPYCGCTELVKLTSTNEKLCSDCRQSLPWYLEDGQMPLLGPARVVK